MLPRITEEQQNYSTYKHANLAGPANCQTNDNWLYKIKFQNAVSFYWTTSKLCLIQHVLTWWVRIRSKPLVQRSRRWLSVNVPSCRVNFEMFHLHELVLLQCHLVLDDRLTRCYRWDAHRDVLTVQWRLGTVAVVESFAETETWKPEQQWGSEYQTNSVFEWSKRVQTPNGPISKCHLSTGEPCKVQILAIWLTN